MKSFKQFVNEEEKEQYYAASSMGGWKLHVYMGNNRWSTNSTKKKLYPTMQKLKADVMNKTSGGKLYIKGTKGFSMVVNKWSDVK